MKEGKIEKLSEFEEKEGETSRTNKIKHFAKKHKKEIFFGIGVAVATGVTIFFVKNPQHRKMIVLKIKDKFGKRRTKVIDVSSISDEMLSGLIEEVEQKTTSNDQYIGETCSARKLGEMIGLTPQQVNKKLCELGYLEGEPGNWQPTKKGEAVSVQDAYNNSVGGYYKIYSPYLKWKKELVYELGNPEEYKAKVKAVRSALGL